MKYLIYSDLHWSKNSSILIDKGLEFSKRLENCILTMNWLYSLAKRENCAAVISCGDFFDRPNLNSEEISALKKLDNKGLEEWFLVGNHEASNLDLSYSSTNVFSGEVIKDVTVKHINDYVDFVFIPYITTTGPLDLGNYVKSNKKTVVFSHNDIAGISYQKGLISQSGFTVDSILNNCSLFLNGHLHTKSLIKDRIFILGNITGKNFSENKNKHCAYLLSIEGPNISIEEIENPYALNFDHQIINKVSDLKLKDNLVLSVQCPKNIVQEVKEVLDNKVVAYKIIVDDISRLEKDKKELTFRKIDYDKEFIKFVHNNFESSDLLESELSLLVGGD